MIPTIRTHNNSNFHIQTCGKGFKTSGALYTHRPLHSNEKSFICQHCPYRANTKNNLKIHDRIHSGVRPYKCRFCAVKFTTSSNMQKHMRNIHEKEKTNKVAGYLTSFHVLKLTRFFVYRFSVTNAIVRFSAASRPGSIW